MRRFLAVCALVLVPGAARAQALKECVSDAEEGQNARDQGKLVEARRRFMSCARTACPDVVQSDCQAFLSKLEARMPSVVFVAKDGAGNDLVDVSVTMDGSAVASTLGGSAVEVNPGSHVFRFEAKTGRAVETRVVIREFEKGRAITAVLDRAASPAAASPSGAGAGLPALTWILSGVAVAGGLGFAGLWLSANSDVRDREQSCAPFCTRSEVSSIETKYILADVSLAVAGAAALGAIVVYLARPSSPARAALGPPAFRF